MRSPRFQIRSLMIVVADAAVACIDPWLTTYLTLSDSPDFPCRRGDGRDDRSLPVSVSARRVHSVSLEPAIRNDAEWSGTTRVDRLGGFFERVRFAHQWNVRRNGAGGVIVPTGP